MIIRRVHVRRFRKLVDQAFDCGPGLNVIRGRNDAGKSTLHLAFSAALFPIRPSEAQSYGPWGEERPGEITIEFEVDECVYRLHKDLGSRKVLLLGSETRWEAPKAVEEQIGKVLGLSSVSLFRATAHIGQWELSAVQDEKQEIGTRLARIMTGGESDAGRILNALDDRIQRLEVGLRRPSKTPGPLKRDADRVAWLTGEQRRLAAEVDAVERGAAERDHLTVRITEREQSVREDAALLEANRRLHDLDRRWDELNRRATELRALLDRIEEASRDLDAAGRDEALTMVPPDSHAVQNLREAAWRAEMLRRESRTDERTEGATGPRTGLTPWWSLAGAFVAVGAGLGGMALLLRHEVVGGIGAFALAFVAGAALIAARRHAAAIEAGVRSRWREDTRRQTEARQRSAAEAEETVRRLLGALGVSSVQEAVERQERAARARVRQDSAARVLNGLLGGRTRESVAEEYQRVVVELGATQAQRDAPDLVLRRLDPAAFQHLQTEADRRRQELESARAARHALDGRLSGRFPQEDLARTEEELAETRARLAREQRQVEVLKLTRDVLEEAHKYTIVPGKERLEERASEYLRVLTGGTYERVTVDAQTLAPRVWVGPPKEWADVASREIGSGAVDQCYLALRLGLVDLLTEGRKPPLFLDDPFLAYDEERQAAAMDLLRALARDRQIFLFTCRGIYDAYADHLLLLGDVRASAPAS